MRWSPLKNCCRRLQIFSGNRKAVNYICFSMETNYSRLFYMGIAYEAYPEKGMRLAKTGLQIKKLEREFPYFSGPGREMGRLQIYHTLLPQYCGKTFFRARPKQWKRESAARLMGQARETAMIRWDCREQLWTPELGENREEIPRELLAACLYQCRPFDRLCVSLEEEDGEYGLRRALDLLRPYLPRMRQVTYVGGETPVSLLLETWMYEEFGIIMTRAQKATADLPWLDLREEKGQEDHGEALNRSANKNSFRHINCREVLKFLDTAVKNGYNTKVN